MGHCCSRFDPIAESGYDEFNIGATMFQRGIQPHNYVRTTRYTPLTFLPLTLLENFTRMANVYFLVMAILGFFPFSPIPWTIQFLPLLFVIAVSMLKALIEDLFRYFNDKKYNAVKFSVFRSGRFRRIPSAEIRPGDIVRVRNGKEIPSDMIVLATSEPGHVCYVNEVNLNGETSVKQRHAMNFFNRVSFPREADSVAGHVTVPLPCKDLTSLNGTLGIGEDTMPFSMPNCVLRGTLLAHTNWMIGLVLYTGHDTRIVQNQRHAPHKTSHLEGRLNQIVSGMFVVNLFLIIISTVLAMTHEKYVADFPFIEPPASPAIRQGLEVMCSFAIIYSYMIPISLYVTIEFVRFFQRWTFSTDLWMYHEELGFCQPNNSNLNEELGQVQHVFSDKTGTLTENRMKFVQCYAAQNIYEVGAQPEVPETLRDLLVCVAVNHSVIVTADGFSSESPDEEALVCGSALLGVSFIGRVPGRVITIQIGGETVDLEHLATVPFDSDRKRMSVVVRFPDGQIVLFTKGADSVMLQLFSDDGADVARQVDAWAEHGLRTLLCGSRVLAEDEWVAFKARFDQAGLSLDDRERKMKAVGMTIEHDLNVLGALAIEDELQANVADTIGFLANMEIILWVLTGDKRETAVSIARSTRVITLDCSVVELNEPEDCRRAVDECQSQNPAVLVISPHALEYLLGKAPELLVEIAGCCRSVICYRMSPYLKSCVVGEVQSRTKRICLAIGDGANDVNMIQTANVGVGIIGREGRQAASNSDFAIPRFRHLKRLLAVHGRLSLVRLSGVIRYMFYKNIVFSLPQFWFFFYTNWAPTPIYDSWLLASYNLIWTILPPFEFGFFEQDISVMSMMTRPVTYVEAKGGKYLSWWHCLADVVNAVYQSLILFYLHIVMPQTWLVNDRGYPDGRISAGTSLFTAIVVVVDVQIAIRSQHWNVFLFLVVVISILVFALLNLPYGSFPDLVPQMYYVPQMMFTCISSYMVLLLSVVAALAPEAVISFMVGLWRPSATRRIREAELIKKSTTRKYTLPTE
jgi:phospholipid-transporting ATPase